MLRSKSFSKARLILQLGSLKRRKRNCRSPVVMSRIEFGTAKTLFIFFFFLDYTPHLNPFHLPQHTHMHAHVRTHTLKPHTPALTSTGHAVTSHPVWEIQTQEGGNEVKKEKVWNENVSLRRGKIKKMMFRNS